MTFVFPILLGGAALAGIPILLHLIVRRKPIRLPFPAFRFLVQQHRTNVRKLRLRHLLLLALRVFLIVAMCLLLARPRLFQRVLGLDGERPVNAVLVFDTSASMEYRSSDGATRLDEAKQRARQLLDELPAGSQIAIVDSADARGEQPAVWLSLNDARQAIGNLKLRPANAPVSQALLKGLAYCDQETADRTGRTGPARLRLLAVFSDRTRASWDAGQLAALTDRLDRLPPMYEGLTEARGQLGSLHDMLRDLRQQLPPSTGKDFNEQSLAESLTTLQNELTGLAPEVERWPMNLNPARLEARRLARELLAQVPRAEAATGETLTPSQVFANKLRAGLSEFLTATGGAQLLYFDVGMESPVELALAQVALPRGTQGLEQQVFAEGESFTLEAVVQATGKAAPATVVCQVGDARTEFRINEVKPGEPQVVPFEIGQAPLLLKPGENTIEVRLDTAREPVPLSQRRFATVRVQPRRNVLVLTDELEQAKKFRETLESLGHKVGVKTARGVPKEALAGQAAVYLLGAAAPEELVWQTLTEYVRGGGALGIVPAGPDLKTGAYNSPAAQALMPGVIKDKLDGMADVGSPWNWSTARYKHSFMRRFEAWKDNERIDFIRYPRGALAYWDVAPAKDSLVLVEYDDAHRKPGGRGKPAVLERLFNPDSGMKGKVLLFTTPMDEPTWTTWNNYAKEGTHFYATILLQATGYLAGESTPPQLNFILGRGDPVVSTGPLPAIAGQPTLRRDPDYLKAFTLDPAGAPMVFRELTAPGNYLLEAKLKENGELRQLAAFSLNIPSEECDLSKVPAGEIEPLFVGDALLTLGRRDSLHDALRSHRSEPVDLMPYFMLAILFALALENLLANRFYRQPEAA
jgi:hypothetical protein